MTAFEGKPTVPLAAAADWQSDSDNARWVRTSLRIAIPGATAPQIESLGDLYIKAVHNQWDANSDLDWGHALNPENPLQMPDATLPIAMTPMWTALGDNAKADVRRHMQGWHISQILHGERASMLCAGKLLLSADDPSVKACAAIQAVDEVRHVEVYAKLLDKVGVGYPVSPSLDRLLFNVLEDPDPNITALGMQILIEGLALAFFKSLQLYSRDPLVKTLLSLVTRDEARHFACGRIALAKHHRELNAAELREREEFVVQAFFLLNDYLFADELWEPLGLPVKECAELARTSPVSAVMHRTLFRQLVPTVRTIGLLGSEARRAFTSLGVIEYSEFPA